MILLSGALALPALPVHADATAYLFEAAERGTASEVKAALEAGANPNAIEINSGMTALHFLAVRNDLPSVIAASIAALIEGGADPNARGEKSPTGHWMARFFPNAQARAMTIALSGGGTPLHLAAFNTNPSVIAALIEGGADPNARGEDGITPLHVAPMFISSPSVIAALIEGGADPNARGKGDVAPLHLAARRGDPSVVMALLEGGADPNAHDENGATPLHLAAVLRSANMPAVIVALIEAGANPGAHNEDGKTPFDFAKKNEALKGTEAYRLLKEGRFE